MSALLATQLLCSSSAWPGQGPQSQREHTGTLCIHKRGLCPAGLVNPVISSFMSLDSKCHKAACAQCQRLWSSQLPPHILRSIESPKQKALPNTQAQVRGHQTSHFVWRRRMLAGSCNPSRGPPGPSDICGLKEQEMKRFDAVQRPAKDPRTSKLLLEHTDRESATKLSVLSCSVSFRGPLHKSTEA